MPSQLVKSIVSGIALVVIAGGVGYAFFTSDHGVETTARSTGTAPAPMTPTPHAPRVAPPPVADPHPAPLQVFATAQVGDWAAATVVSTGAFGSAAGTHATVIDEIVAADATTVTHRLRGHNDATGEVVVEPTDEFPRAGLILEQLTGDDIGGWALSEITTTTEPHTVNGRAFACTKISYASADPMFPGKHTHTDLWISSEVPAGGLVESHEVQDLDAMHFEITKQVIAFGGASGSWGARPGF